MKGWFALKRMAWIAVLAALLCISSAGAETFTLALPWAGAAVEVCTSEMDGEQWLFLPAFADPASLPVELLDEEADEEGVRRAELDGQPLSIMQAQNLRALFLFSDDPQNQGRAYIDGGERHSTETTGYMALIAPDGTVEHADRLRQLRGRGNGSWGNEKKPYQFKLENRADLLKTGDPSEMARTWVLLADYMDPTRLHNRIALDLALEMGLEETSHSEFVDLYYDGEYRGMYLLAEKVEIDPARVDEMDYDKLIEEWNESAGVTNLETLSVGSGENRFGNPYTYIENLHDSGVTDAGAYLLEMEDAVGTLTDRCWFQMSDLSTVALKNPENASEPMVRDISEKLENARSILQNGGISEDGSQTIHDVFDVDDFARTALLYELSYSDSGFHYSSTFFVLPAGAQRFEPGPVWDFDLTWRYYQSGVNDQGIGLKDQAGWLPEFYSVPAFSERMKEIYLEEMYPLVQDVLLGDGEGRYLQSIDSYLAHIEASLRMNNRLWQTPRFWRQLYAEGGESETELLRRFLDERSEWLRAALEDARPDADAVTLWGYAPYTYVPDRVGVYACPWNHVNVRSVAFEQLSEATEEEYALWQLTAEIEPQPGYTFENPAVTFNGREISHERLADGGLRICVTFQDLSYRPVDYYGEDIGLIYNPDVYAANYPEIAAEYEEDPEGLMDYFCDEGMYEDHRGNAFFKPSDILLFNPELEEMFGEDWQLYYWDYLYYGYADGWLHKGARGYALDVQDAL